MTTSQVCDIMLAWYVAYLATVDTEKRSFEVENSVVIE